MQKLFGGFVKQNTKSPGRNVTINTENSISSDELLSTDQEQDPNNKDYAWVKSFGSCKVDDIHGIIFGGLSSRFWMLRKHINLMKTSIIKSD